MTLITTFLAWVAVWIVVVAAGTWVLRLRARWMAARRTGEDFETFAASFAAAAAPPDILRAVYTRLQREMADDVAAFPIRATDDLGHIYGLADEDLDDLIGDLVRECGRDWPAPADLDRCPPVETVAHLATFLARCPRAGLGGRPGESPHDARRPSR